MRALIVAVIRFYQKCISIHLKSQCKFYPTCSEYALMSIEKFGLRRGIWKTLRRLAKCHPLSRRGGIDFPF
ncbi:MAG: membrane protein insertion efficiency factor YidD [Holosporaceae bacterium]|nr:membrane protein insertion efficiency factor YidD [Holosporaceae bacterium]